jgi:DNA-binding transcriptional regulator YiaG
MSTAATTSRGEAYTTEDEALRRFRENPSPTPAPEASERIARVEVTDEHIVFDLQDGRRIMMPLTWSWRLLEATPEERQNFQISPSGYGVHWPDVDEDLSGRGALRGTPAPRPGSRPGLRAQREAKKKTLEGRWTPGLIKRLRKARDETQEAFARAMGVRQATISAWENANQDPSPMALRLLEQLASHVDLAKL